MAEPNQKGKNKQTTVSFIIPIFNTPTEKMCRCFNSVAQVDVGEKEVILIDDGSDGYVEEFCQKYIIDHNEFFYYRQEKSGVSSARNKGIDIANGKYISFIDSDDEVISEAYKESLFNEEFNLMVLDLEYFKSGDSGIRIASLPDREEGEYKRELLLSAIFQNPVIGGPFAKIFSRDFLNKNNIRFNVSMQSGEDAEFNIQVLLAINVFIYNRIAVYRYYYSPHTGVERIIRNPIKALASIEKGFDRKLEAVMRMEFDAATRDHYIAQVHRKAFTSLKDVVGGIAKNKLLDKELKIQIKSVVKKVDKKFFCGMDKIFYEAIAYEKWWVLAFREQLRLCWIRLKRILYHTPEIE